LAVGKDAAVGGLKGQPEIGQRLVARGV